MSNLPEWRSWLQAKVASSVTHLVDSADDSQRKRDIVAGALIASEANEYVNSIVTGVPCDLTDLKRKLADLDVDSDVIKQVFSELTPPAVASGELAKEPEFREPGKRVR